VEGLGGAAAARAEALMLEALAVWRRLRAEQERAAAEEATLFKTKTRANSILSEAVSEQPLPLLNLVSCLIRA
jgi:hypothetical protein